MQPVSFRARCNCLRGTNQHPPRDPPSRPGEFYLRGSELPPISGHRCRRCSSKLRHSVSTVPLKSLSLSLSRSPELLMRRAPCRRRAAKSVESMASLSSVDGMQSSPSEIWIETLHLLYPPSLSASEGRSDRNNGKNYYSIFYEIL